MMRRVFLFVCVTSFLALLTLPVQAQEWSAEQREVWDFVSKQWEMEKAGDQSWLDMFHPSFQGWPVGAPTPYGKDVVKQFFSVEAGRDDILVQHLAPISIIVTEGTAVAHYYYTLLIEHRDGERETSTGRSTDVLTKTGDGWQYLSWIGQERPVPDE